MFTLKEIEFFLTLCEYESVSKTAEELLVTQSAVSLAVKSLEEKLGEKIFDRIGKKLILNERGRYFKDIIKPHFLALKDAKSVFAKNRVFGKLRVIASKTISNYLLAEPIYRFLSDFKEAKIEKKTQNSHVIAEKILNGEADIGFVESEIKEIDIKSEKIADDELIVVTGDRELAQKERFMDTLLEKKWILRERGSGTREIFLKNIGDLSKKLHIFLEFSELEEIKSVLYHKDTLTCISNYAVKRELEDKKLFRIKIKNILFNRNLYLIYHKNKTKTKLFEEFVSFIKREMKNLS